MSKKNETPQLTKLKEDLFYYFIDLSEPNLYNKIKNIEKIKLEIILEKKTPELFQCAKEYSKTAGGYLKMKLLNEINQLNVSENILKILQNKFHDIVETASNLGISEVDYQSVGVALENILENDLNNIKESLEIEVSPVASKTLNDAENISTNVASEVDINQNISRLQKASSAVAQSTSVIGGLMSNVAQSIDFDTVQDVVTMTLSSIGVVAGAVPFLAPLQVVLMKLAENIKNVNQCEQIIQCLQRKCQLYGYEVTKASPDILQQFGPENNVITPLVESIKALQSFIDKYGKRSYLRNLISDASQIKGKLENLERELDLNFSMLLSSKSDASLQLIKQQYALSQDALNRLNTLGPLIDQIMKRPQSSITNEDIEKICFATCSNQVDAAKKELYDAMNVIQQENLARFQKIEEDAYQQSQQIKQTSEKVQSVSEDFKTHKLQYNAFQQSTETHQMENNLKFQALFSQTEKYSTVQELDYHALRSQRILSDTNRYKTVLIHCNGVGFSKFPGRDGTHGKNGLSYPNFGPAIHGRSGSYGASGENGRNGESGNDGGDGSGGDHGRDCENFVVEIFLLSVDGPKRTYRVAVTNRIVFEEVVELIHPNHRFYINGRGGNGGNG